MVKKILVSALAVALVFSCVPLSAVAIANHRNLQTISSGTPYFANLNIGDSNLLSTFSTGSYSTHTSRQGAMDWVYNRAKLEGGALVLGRLNSGNSTLSEGYIGNNLPITSVRSISITFIGSYITLYGSSDNVEFHRIETVRGAAISVTRTFSAGAEKYLYFRFANGDREMGEVKISDISISYACNPVDFTPELSDISSDTSDLKEAAAVVSANEYVPFSETASTSLIKFTTGSTYVNFNLPRTIAVSEVDRYQIRMHWNIDNAALSDGNGNAKTTAYCAFQLARNNSSKTQSTTTANYAVKGNGYVNSVTPLSNCVLKDGASEFNQLFIRLNRTIDSGYVLLDGVYLEEIDTYPTGEEPEESSSAEPASSEAPLEPLPEIDFDAMDFTNLAFLRGWGSASDGGMVTSRYSVVSDEDAGTGESRLVNLPKSNQAWHFSHLEGDMQGKTLRFDVALGSYLDDVNYHTLNFIFEHNGKFYRKDILSPSSGIISESFTGADGSSWIRVTMNFDQIAANSAKLDKEPSNIGFTSGGYASFYFDNMTFLNWTAPDYSGSTFYDVRTILGQINHGWNLGNDLDCRPNSQNYSQWVKAGRQIADMFSTEHQAGNIPVTDSIVKTIAGMGFNAIRIPVTWFPHMDENDIVSPQWLYRVKEAVDYVISRGMICIINVHHDDGTGGWLRAMDSDVATCNGMTKADINRKFAKLWRQIATFFESYDYHLLFEGHNETLDNRGNEESDYVTNNWTNPDAAELAHINELNQIFVDTVRATGGNNLKRTLICSPYAAGARDLECGGFVLPNDPLAPFEALAAEVHSYIPHSYTDSKDPELEYTPAIKSEIDAMWAIVKKYFVDEDIPVIMGEYGTRLPSPTDESRIAWMQDYIRGGQALGVKLFHWDDGGSMLFIKRNSKAYNPDVYNAAYNAAYFAMWE